MCKSYYFGVIDLKEVWILAGNCHQNSGEVIICIKTIFFGCSQVVTCSAMPNKMCDFISSKVADIGFLYGANLLWGWRLEYALNKSSPFFILSSVCYGLRQRVKAAFRIHSNQYIINSFKPTYFLSLNWYEELWIVFVNSIAELIVNLIKHWIPSCSIFSKPGLLAGTRLKQT